jgi:hypothetical protein
LWLQRLQLVWPWTTTDEPLQEKITILLALRLLSLSTYRVLNRDYSDSSSLPPVKAVECGETDISPLFFFFSNTVNLVLVSRIYKSRFNWSGAPEVATAFHRRNNSALRWCSSAHATACIHTCPKRFSSLPWSKDLTLR